MNKMPINDMPINEWLTALTDPALGLTLTIGSFILGQKIYRACGGHPLLHPVLLAVVPVIALLELTDTSYQQYQASTSLFTLLLGTATVALAVPLYSQLRLIRRHARTVLITLAAGAAFAPAVALALAWLLGAQNDVLLSLAPKSVTSPIAMAVAESIGGLPAIAAGAVICTGNVGAVLGPVILDKMAISSQLVRGFTLGLTAHAVGTARAFELDPVAGSFASLGLALTGAFTAFFMPLLWYLLS